MYDVVDQENGYRQCTFGHTEEQHQQYFDNVKNIQCRDDDFLLNSYPKTGTNWLWEMLSMVMLKTIFVTSTNKGPGMIEATSTENTEKLPSPRILNTHLKVKYIPKVVLEKRLKMVLLLRNPKDVVVSFYNHTKGIRMYNYDGKFENYLKMFMRGEVDYGSYPEYLYEWQSFMKENPVYPLHVMYYEDLKQDCLGEMKKVCEFLELDFDPDMLENIVGKCQIDTLRAEKTNNLTPELKDMIQQAMKSNFSMYRKGQIGDWKNWFTVAQNELFEQWWESETKGISVFSFRYT